MSPLPSQSGHRACPWPLLLYGAFYLWSLHPVQKSVSLWHPPKMKGRRKQRNVCGGFLSTRLPNLYLVSKWQLHLGESSQPSTGGVGKHGCSLVLSPPQQFLLTLIKRIPTMKYAWSHKTWVKWREKQRSGCLLLNIGIVIICLQCEMGDITVCLG